MVEVPEEQLWREPSVPGRQRCPSSSPLCGGRWQ